jgi:hypothetical protein
MQPDGNYDIGDLVEITIYFKDQDGAPDDPTAITFTQRDPRGVEVVLDETDATNPAVGEWRWILPQAFDQPGIWRFRGEATDGLVTAVERSVKVNRSLFS